jgi:hypothetical protein
VNTNTLGEDFFEFMGAYHFKQKGYFVTKWHPYSGSDFFAYRIPEYQKELQKRGYISKGAFFSELDMPRALRENEVEQTSQRDEYDVIAFEAEDDYGLPLHSHNGVGQKIGFASPTCEVYGVGPIRGEPPSRGDTRFPRAPWSFGKRAGALVFTDKNEKRDLEPLESGFKDEDEVIRRVKIAIKTILASRLPSIQKSLGIERLRDFPERMAKIELAELLEILEKNTEISNSKGDELKKQINEGIQKAEELKKKIDESLGKEHYSSNPKLSKKKNRMEIPKSYQNHFQKQLFLTKFNFNHSEGQL